MSDQDDLWVPCKTIYSILIIKTIKLSKKMDLHDYLNGTLYQPCDGWLRKKSKCKIFLISFKSRHHCLTFVLQNFHGWSKCLIECVALCHVCSIIWTSIKGFNEILTIWPAWPTHPLLQLIEQCALHCPNESESIQERFPTSSSQVTFL